MICPSCKKTVAPGASNCPTCGQVMPAVADGTLEVGQHFEAEAATPATAPESAATPPLSVQPAAAAAQGTLGAPEIVEPSRKKQQELQETIVPVAQSADAVDADATIQLPGASADVLAAGTAQYGEQELQDAQAGKGKSGTAGRLKRLWQGVAGSSSNPMHTLKGNDAMATDSVFAKVARRVLVEDTTIDITEKIGTTASASQPEKKARVKECIALACSGADSEAADYHLTGFLGQGGMGVVLKARQKAIGRDVAIKMIQPSAGSSTSSTNAQKKKFFYEAQITGKLDHPNIVPVYELGVSNEILFYSMKMIIGQEWKHLIQTNTRDQNLDTLMKVCDAMAFAHQKQIIHRDLKPENVMIGPFGEVLVTDWGCAVDLSRGENFTGAGSPPWMAPEMADHSVDKIGPRSDIYLLGAMLYQIIAGYPPHPGQTVFECLSNAQKNIIIPVEDHDPLLDIAMRAMETEPSDRYQTVEALQADIREYRKHAESITLSDRSAALLTQAIASKDYERFSRTIFGFQDAVELWPGNTAAQTGLAEARLAYGQCAYGKGDYDLCLQSLNQKVPAEAELYAKAAKAKKAAEDRERRFKTMRKALAAVILLGLGISSAFAGVAWWQRGQAIEARNDANVKKAEAEQSAKEAKEAAFKEAEQRVAAEQATELARIAQGNAEMAQAAAESATKMETAAKMQAETEKKNAEREKQIAEQQKMLAEMESKRADAEKLIAEERTAEVELGAFQAKLANAIGQVKQFNIAGASAEIENLLNPTSYAALSARGKLPKFDNWSVNRVQLLSNAKLLGKSLGDVSAVAFASDANLGVVATTAGGKGNLQVVRLDGKELKVVQSQATEAPVGTATVSPNGDEVIYTLKTDVASGVLYSWKLSDGGQPVKVEQNKNRQLQSFVMSTDRVIGGVSGGIWVWERNANWSTSEPKKISSVRGRLESLQLINDTTALALAQQIDNKLTVHSIDLQQAEGREVVLDRTGSDLENESLSAIAYANGRLILGTASGKLFSVDMAPNATSVGPEFRQILPQQHQSSIRSISAHIDGTLITTAIEPVVQVWKPTATQSSGWQHESFLAGMPDNMGGVSFMIESNLVLGVGESGRPIVWDIARQKQRQKIERIDTEGNLIKSSSPAIEVLTSNSNRAVSILANGDVDTWDLVTGKSIGLASQNGLALVGHTPGALFTDMAIAADAGILVTSAELPKDASEATAVRKWEYCKWDLNSGKMLDRWQRESEAEQQISLLDGGKLIVYASNSETIIQEARTGGAIQLNKEKLSTFFAANNPVHSHIAMLVKRSGAVRLYNAKQPEGGITLPENNVDYNAGSNSNLLSVDEYPLIGDWAPNGERFYMVWTSGRVTEYRYMNGQLTIGRDLRDKTLEALGIGLNLDGSAGGRVTSFRQVDLKVRPGEALDLVYLAYRLPGTEANTRIARVAFPYDEQTKPIAEKQEPNLGPYRFVLTDTEVPNLDIKLFSALPVSSKEVVATRSVGNHTFCATNSGVVYRVNQQNEVTVLGRPETLSGCGNAEANKVVTLHTGGVLWRGDLKDDQWSWTQLEKTVEGANRVNMSPDGSKLLISFVAPSGESGMQIAETETGKVLETIDRASCGTWNDAGDLALVMADGSIESRGANGNKAIGKVSGQALSAHYFTEPWSAGEPSHWLAVHVKSDDESSKLQYFSLDGAIAGDETERFVTLPANTSRVSCSPKDGIFVTGGTGVVSVNFATPTLGEYGKQLFNLEGHAGAEITCLKFSDDGKTLVTSDSEGRLFGWLSEDSLEGISQPLAVPAGVAPIQ